MRPALTNALTTAIRSALSYTANEAADAEQWVAQLDGAMQYWQLTEEIPVPDGGSIELDLMYDSENQSAIEYVLTSENSSDTALFFASREFIQTGSSGYISDVLVDGVSASVLPYDNAFHTIKCIASGGLTKVGILAARFNYTRTSSGTIKMFRVRDSNGVVVNEIPLTNKAQGATQLATVGNINAFMPNYTEAVWRKP
ncbi:hypothetical protein [Pseudoalteromonas sp. meg-B1]|uniref:hypothetical protein n=1 Tax=Pseudoalteromonas sp. meg-B1 TaxID=2203192 RepID=UPI000D6F5743|nr:hypothetical protein [Pseudoalteromonas sp. meg-B1]PWS55998.1 hypothetical protein DK924_04465 [Pseudoalteromonas sp. meg-B1]